MDLASLIVNIVLAVVALAAAIVAGLQARAAITSRNDARTAQGAAEQAQREATEIARSATAAFVRQAAAQERGNELAEAALPKPAVEWIFEQTGKYAWLARNAGTITAYKAQVTDADGADQIEPTEEEPRDVTRGDSLTFQAFTFFTSTGHPRARIAWEEHLDGGVHLRNIERNVVSTR